MEFVDKSRKGFFSAMEDDFSTPEALASMYSLVRESNKRAESGMGAEEARHVIDVMLEFDSILGLEFDKRPSRTDKLSEEVEKLIKERNEARKHKDFAEADRIRRVLKEKGVTLEDTAHGTVWKSSD
jgi:cysteinyl-tRNA synthetase